MVETGRRAGKRLPCPQKHPAAGGVILSHVSPQAPDETAVVAEGAIVPWYPVPGEWLSSLSCVICHSSVSVLGSAPDKLLHLGPCLSMFKLEPCHTDQNQHPWATVDSTLGLSKTETLF